MRKSMFYTLLVMAFFFFLWWFMGGTVIGSPTTPSPAERSAQFLWQNFQVGVATVFEAFSNLVK